MRNCRLGPPPVGSYTRAAEKGSVLVLTYNQNQHFFEPLRFDLKGAAICVTVALNGPKKAKLRNCGLKRPLPYFRVDAWKFRVDAPKKFRVDPLGLE